ncbi:hypothetical protein IV203_011898 [Nitzschia inconspicua]|uniref:DUF6824 domain-containing protein n=1 Tax=Nitzschia inconspicua TaxID=303405 RepID=A0A9K3PJP9_9STRA|nr:hypothetical protein IV203_011898 [Nitzschia inconspicua]
MRNSTPAACMEANEGNQEEETILQVGEQDILFGRGGKSYSHPGNRLFRRLIFHHKDLYEDMKKPQHRQFLALSIVEAMRRSGAKFLRKDSTSDKGWKTVSDKEACIKTSQALRDASVRTKKKCNKITRNESFIQANFIPDEDHDIQGKDRNVVSPCNSSSPTAGTMGPVSCLASHMQIAPTAHVQEDLEDIDHIDLETIQTLVRSLGATHPQSESTAFPSSARSATQPSGSKYWSKSKPTYRQKQAASMKSRSSFLVLDWLSKEVTNDRELPPAALQPLRQDHQSTISRCSISSISMLEAGLLGTDFDFDDFEIDSDSFPV